MSRKRISTGRGRKSNKKVEAKDKCAMCGNETDYTPDIHIRERIGHIEGAGQLCRSCYSRVYGGEDIAES